MQYKRHFTLITLVSAVFCALAAPASAIDDAKPSSQSYEVVLVNEAPKMVALDVAKQGEPCSKADVKTSASIQGQPRATLLLQRCASLGNSVHGELTNQANVIRFKLDIAAGEKMVFDDKGTGTAIAVIRRTH